MAVGDLWRIGVWHPISNWSCRYPARRQCTFGISATAGATSIRLYQMPGGVSAFHAYRPSHIISAGDVLTLGPSTVAAYSGLQEQVVVSSIDETGYPGTQATIYLTSMLTRSYSISDPIHMIGSRFPGEWGHRDDGGEYSLHVTNSMGSGMDDERALYITKTTSTGANIITFSWSSGNFRTPYLLPSVYYYFWVHYKVATISGLFQLYNTNLNASAILTLGSATAWTEVGGVYQFAGGTLTSPHMYLRMASSASCTNLSIDCLGMCHADGTDDATSGVYTFDDYADRGSVSHGMLNKMATNTFASNVLVGNTLVGADPKYYLSAKFSDSSLTTYTNLKRLLYWQRRGSLLCLKTYLPNLPPYLIGRLGISGYQKVSWDLNRCSFGIQFTEA